MKEPLRWPDFLSMNVYYIGITTLSQSNSIIVPLLVQNFVGEGSQGTAFGNLRLWTLMVALLVQSGVGIISDHSRLRWGRRRPFIFLGTLLDLLFIAAIGYSIGLQGTAGYWFLFSAALLLQGSTNIAHAAQQGFIPDLVPENKRGVASGIKAFFELPLPLLLVSFTVARLVGGGNIWGALFITMGVLLLTMVWAMFVPERVPRQQASRLDWSPFIRLLLMTGLFTLFILASGGIVQLAGQQIRSLSNTTAQILLMGTLGAIAMFLAIALGVWSSVRLSLGETATKHHPFTWWIVSRLAYMTGVINLSTFAVFFIQARLGYLRETAAQPAAILMLLVGVFIMVSALPSGWLADRFGFKRLSMFSGVLAAIGTLITLLVPNLTLIYIGGSLIGVATGIFYTSNWALGTSLIPEEQAARFLGIGNLAGAGAGAVGAYIGGPIADYFTRNLPGNPGIGYVLLFSIYGILFLFSATALIFIRHEHNVRPEPLVTPAPAEKELPL